LIKLFYAVSKLPVPPAGRQKNHVHQGGFKTFIVATSATEN
jgi:hypothetical protein